MIKKMYAGNGEPPPKKPVKEPEDQADAGNGEPPKPE